MRKTHKALTLILSLVMLFTLMPSMAFAKTSKPGWIKSVTGIKFTPSATSDADRFILYEVYDAYEKEVYDEQSGEIVETYICYDWYFEDGDSLELTTSDTTNNKHTLVYKEFEDYDDRDGWYEGNTLLDLGDDYPTVEDDQEDNHQHVDETHYFTISWGNAIFTQSVQIRKSPITKIEFTPNEERENVYTEEEMEGYYYYDSFEPARYDLGFVEGDKLTDTYLGGRQKTYTYYESKVYDEDLQDWFDVFESEDGSDIIEDLDDPAGPLFETDTPSSTAYEFKVRLLDQEDIYKVFVTESDPDDISLAREKSKALNELDGLYHSLDNNDYRIEQWREMWQVYLDSSLDIMNAESEAEVKTALEAGKKAIRSIKTDAQLKEESAAAKRKAEAEAAANLKFNGVPDGSVPATKALKAKGGKKSFTVKWKKTKKNQLKQFDKVEIQYSLNPLFPRGATQSQMAKKTKTSLKIKKLPKKSVYYVRVRNVKFVGNVKHVSGWSSYKKVKIK